MTKIETVYENGTAIQLDFEGRCPKCDFDWNGGDILETFKNMRASGDAFYGPKTDEELIKYAQAYGWTEEEPKCFSRIIGIELPYTHPKHYDGVSLWACPSCDHRWNRFND